MLQHPITENDVLAYARDGVVCIRDQFDTGLVEKARKICVEYSTGTAPNLVAADDADGGPGRTIVSSHMARTKPEFMELVTGSPAAETAARLMGAKPGRIIWRHMMPSFMSHLIASATLSVPAMILGETALSFLGLGLRPPITSWGVLLAEAQNINVVALYPWLMLPLSLIHISEPTRPY